MWIRCTNILLLLLLVGTNIFRDKEDDEEHQIAILLGTIEKNSFLLTSGSAYLLFIATNNILIIALQLSSFSSTGCIVSIDLDQEGCNRRLLHIFHPSTSDIVKPIHSHLEN